MVIYGAINSPVYPDIQLEVIMSPDSLINSWAPDVKLAPTTQSSELLDSGPIRNKKPITFTEPSMPLFIEKHYHPTYSAWKADPSPANSSVLLNMVDPIINEAVRTYGGSSQKSPILRSKAKLMALKAIEGYDPTKAKLRTHLLSQMQGLRRLAAKEDQILNIPEQVLLDLGNLRESENRLRDKIGRDPSDIELADHLGLSKKRIAYLRTMKPSFAEGKLVKVDDEGTSISQPAVESSNTEGRAAWHDFVYHDLDPIDQQIMEYTLGMHNKPVLSNQELAKTLRLSPGAVSQRKSRIQTKMDQIEDTGLFGL